MAETCDDMTKLEWETDEEEERRERAKNILTPGDELVKNLESLRLLLNQLHEKLNQSGVERTFNLKRIMGNDCRYYQKSMNLFIDEDFESLRDLVTELYDLFLLVEGKKK